MNGTATIAEARPYSYTVPHSTLRGIWRKLFDAILFGAPTTHG